MARNTKAALTEAFNEDVNRDVTQAPQAMTQQDVEGQDARTRLWQSLDQTYGQQRQQIDKNYAQAISQTDRAMQNRGMQRSSYAMQTLANLGQEQAKANADSMASQIADYQNRLSSLETQERQFAYQQERDKVADQQWQQQFQAQQDQWKQQFNYQQKTADQQIAYNYIMNMLETGDKPSDSILQQAGISRNDYEQMKKAVVKPAGRSGGSSSRPGTNPGLPTPGTDIPTGQPNSTLSMVDNYNWEAELKKRQQQQASGGAGRRYDMTR